MTPPSPEQRSFTALLADCGGAVMLGAALGALSLAVVGYPMFQARGAIGGAVLGAVLGAFTGLDSMLPAPRRLRSERARQRGPIMGPFRAGASYLLAALAAAILSAHLWGTLTLQCAREAESVRCSRVTRGWFDMAETSRTDYHPITSAYEGGHNQIVVVTPTEERYVIEGFSASALGELQTYLKAGGTTAAISGETPAFAQPVLWAMAVALGLFGGWSLRSGVAQLRQVLAEPVQQNGLATPAASRLRGRRGANRRHGR